MQHRPKIFSAFTLITALGVLFLWNFAHVMYIKNKSKSGIWLEEIVSKGYALETKSEKPDLVFIGSSRTQNHINSTFFENHGIKVFNYGIPGNDWEDYPYMVNLAAKNAKKAVVVNFRPYAPLIELKCPSHDRLIFFNLWLYLTTTKNFKCLFQLKYQDFISSLPMNRFQYMADKRSNVIDDLRLKIEFIKDKYNYDLDKDGRKINYIRGGETRNVVVFKNGDGLVFSIFNELTNDKKAELVKSAEITIKSFNQKTIREENIKYLNLLKNIILSKGKIPIFSPELFQWSHQFNTNLALLRSKISDAYFLEQPSNHYDESLWADEGHLTHMGIKIYNEFILKQISEVLSKSIK